MFKRYKIRKAKQYNDLNVTKKSFSLNTDYIQKTDIQKIKLLLKNSNKSNAYKRIFKLSQELFDRNLYFISTNIMSAYLEADDSVIFNCVKRILNSKQFKSIGELFVGYMDVIKDEKFYDIVRKCQYKVYCQYKRINKMIDLGKYNYDDPIIITYNN